jgi:hypothetical protein
MFYAMVYADVLASTKSLYTGGCWVCGESVHQWGVRVTQFVTSNSFVCGCAYDYA